MASRRDTGHVPITLGCLGYRLLRRFTIDTLPGRWIAAQRQGGGDPVVRVRAKDLVEAGVQRVPRVAGVSGGQPVIKDGRILEVENVVWCTGFVRDYRWIRLPSFDAGLGPIHDRGVVRTQPGLYFVGLPLQSSVTSDLVGGVGADAKHIIGQMTRTQ